MEFSKQIVISNIHVSFSAYSDGVTAAVSFSCDRSDSQHPAISRWVIKQFKEVCKIADEQGLVLQCSSLVGDDHTDLRMKAYQKYMGSNLGGRCFARGVNGTPITQEEINQLYAEKNEQKKQTETAPSIIDLTQVSSFEGYSIDEIKALYIKLQDTLESLRGNGGVSNRTEYDFLCGLDDRLYDFICTLTEDEADFVYDN